MLKYSTKSRKHSRNKTKINDRESHVNKSLTCWEETSAFAANTFVFRPKFCHLQLIHHHFALETTSSRRRFAREPRVPLPPSQTFRISTFSRGDTNVFPNSLPNPRYYLSPSIFLLSLIKTRRGGVYRHREGERLLFWTFFLLKGARGGKSARKRREKAEVPCR